MKKSTRSVLCWAPRILSILFAIFISIFSLDVFGEGYSFWETVLALLIHLVPTYLVLIALAVAWRWEWVGAVLFFALGVFYVVMMRRGIDWISFLLISGPLFLIATLFLVNWILRAKLKSVTPSDSIS